MSKSSIHVDIDPEAMPNYGVGPIHINWPSSEDDIDQLVRFIYGNQGNLFVEDAVLFQWGNTYRISRGEPWERIRGSWETEPERIMACLTSNDIDAIVEALEDHADRMTEQQHATADYTPDDLRTARIRRESVLRALGRS